ncbi:MAG: DegT/DnrJ/EryC1/StrS family aminotransferase [Planctomycetes bacterium]|nr:DegT/DnrJ/EryC1/StrS family aminotransferase [Planctomycetota bacterium]
MSGSVRVPPLDLKAQYARIRTEAEAAVARVFESQQFVLGPEVEALEREIAAYLGASHAVGCASGSDAILLALLGLNIQPGDEVVCPAFTFFATAGYVVRAGGIPVFADIDPVTFNLDIASARRALARCTRAKALLPVHLYGQTAPLGEVETLAREAGVSLVEDAAQAIGSWDAEGRKAGTVGAVGCFSFYPTKNLGGCGDGGMLVTSDPEVAERLRVLRSHGSKPAYFHHVVGLNSRLDALQAAVLRVKLKYLDAWTVERRERAAYYDARFSDAGAATSATPLDSGGLPLRTPHPAPTGARHIYHQYVVRVPAESRDALQVHLKAQGVDTMVYYPLPLHLQPCFKYLGYREGEFPEAERAAREVLALPMYPELTEAQQDRVVDGILSALNDT